MLATYTWVKSRTSSAASTETMKVGEPNGRFVTKPCTCRRFRCHGVRNLQRDDLPDPFLPQGARYPTGRDGRSSNPASPSSRKRRSH